MSFTSWLQNLRSALAPSRGQRHHGRRGSLRAAPHRLNLDILEDRSVPAFLAPVYYDVAAGPVAVVTADFNGDGHLDLATASLHAYPADVSVLLGNGDGTFQPALTTATGAYPAISLAVGDFNADGKADLVIGTLSGPGAGDYSYDAVAVYFGNGDGSFQYGSTFLTDGTDGGLTVGVAVADFDADGRLDMAVAVDWDNAVWVYLDDGDGAPLTPSLRINDATVTEGNTGTASATFTVTLASASTEAITVAYATGNDTATADSDFNSTSGIVTFAPGETSKTITVSVIGDRLAEPNETFVVNLSEPTNATIAEDQGIGTILDDEPRMSINDVTVTEGNTGAVNATFTVSLAAASTDTITVDYATADSTATAGSDFNSTSGIVTFAPGETSKTITVAVIGDRLGEPNEFFVVNLSSPTNATLADGQGIGTILDDDPRIFINDMNATETNTGTWTVGFTLTLSRASSVPVTVRYDTADITARAGSDYVATSGIVTFPAGVTKVTFTVKIRGDRLPELTESLAVNLSAATNATIGDGQATLTILDNEPRMSIGDISVAEGQNGKTLFKFTVYLDVPPTWHLGYDQAVTVSYSTVDGTAKAGEDYIAKTGTLTFAPGETRKTITIEVKGDSKREANETFYLDLFGLSSNASFTKNRGIGTILNDD